MICTRHKAGVLFLFEIKELNSKAKFSIKYYVNKNLDTIATF